MNRWTSLCIIALCMYSAYAQDNFHLIYPFHSDTIVESQFPENEAGAMGDSVTWDFRFLSMPAEYEIKNSFPLAGDTTVLCSHVPHTRYYWHISADSLFLTGWETATSSIRLTQKELQRVSLMQVGDTLRSCFEGTGEYAHRFPFVIKGNTEVIADATGTLLLPAEVVHNTLRLHTIRHYSELMRDSAMFETHTWQWFADAYRYPILEIMHTICPAGKTNGTDSLVYGMTTLFSPSEQEEQNTHITLHREEDMKSRFIDSILTEATYLPNPVLSDLQVSYRLTRDANVMFKLHNPTGICIYHTSSMQQSEGYHTWTIPMDGYMTGAYTLYIIVDDMLIQKVILKR